MTYELDRVRSVFTLQQHSAFGPKEFPDGNGTSHPVNIPTESTHTVYPSQLHHETTLGIHIYMEGDTTYQTPDYCQTLYCHLVYIELHLAYSSYPTVQETKQHLQ